MANELPLGHNINGEELNAIVVDDSSTVRVALKQILNSECFNVVVDAEHGVDAMNKIKLLPKGTTIDIILLDYEMPFMNGVELLKNIRDMGIDSKAVVVTSMSNKNTLAAFLPLGISGLVVKPVERKAVIMNIAKALGRANYITP